ncbi:MAG: hypothetical protein HY689_02415, partial [Chloroflexi bacterium]|nr:hypothetical protein [Chloroflexota bacterium]
VCVTASGEEPPQQSDEIATLTADRLEDQVRMMFTGPTTARFDRVSWLVLGELGETAGGEVEQILMDAVIPCAARLYRDGRLLTLTLVLVDPSSSLISAAADFLATLAGAMHEAGIGAISQVYLLRARMSNGFQLAPPDLARYSALACSTLVLANATEVSPNLSIALHRASAQDANTRGGDPTSLRLFGRLAVQRVRSLAAVLAEWCTQVRLYECARHMGGSGARVPIGWTPPDVTIPRPEVGQDARARIGAALRGGPAAHFTGGPSLWRAPEQEVRRIREEVARWLQSNAAWQREVRVQYERVLRDLRASAASERDRARDAVQQYVMALWTDTRLSPPTVYIADLLSLQKKRWEEERTAQARGLGGLRTVSVADAELQIAQPLGTLAAAMERRPNSWLMLGLALGTVVSSVLVLWHLIGLLDQASLWLPFLDRIDPDLRTKLVVWRVLAVVGVVAAVGAAVGGTLWSTKLRWDRAYADLVGVVAALTTREAEALEREIAVVDRHWYRKTLAAGIRHLSRLEVRLQTVESQLRRIAQPGAGGPAQTEPFTRSVPEESAHATEDRHALLGALGTDAVVGLLRSPEMALRWVVGDSTRWVRDARDMLRRRFLLLWQEHARSAGAPAEHALATILRDWPETSALSLVADNERGSLIPPRHRLIFATGSLAVLAQSAPHRPPHVDVVPYASQRDELVLCQAQTGLDAMTVAR